MQTEKVEAQQWNTKTNRKIHYPLSYYTAKKSIRQRIQSMNRLIKTIVNCSSKENP